MFGVVTGLRSCNVHFRDIDLSCALTYREPNLTKHFIRWICIFVVQNIVWTRLTRTIKISKGPTVDCKHSSVRVKIDDIPV